MKLLLLCISCLVAFSHGVDVAKKFKLSSGHEIPSVGLGTSAIEKEKMEKAIASALDNGYRHIDTAFSYENEALIGKALKAYFDKGGKRENLFVTSKLPSQGNRPQSVEKYLKKSLQDLGLSYVDMYLIHTPFAIKEGKNMAPLEKDGSGVFDDIDHIALWKAMEKQVKEGRAKSIGLSNFNATQISKIYNAAEIKPSNLQVESHAYLQQKKLREFCKQKNIVITAYSPLGSSKSRKAFYPKGSPKDLPPLIENPTVVELAKKYKKTPAQILLRHSVQDGLVVIPKSSSSMRQKENIELFNFKLTDEDFKKISALDEGEKGRVFDYLLFYKDLQNNPEYPWGGSSE